jgi:hypothetical protein
MILSYTSKASEILLKYLFLMSRMISYIKKLVLFSSAILVNTLITMSGASANCGDVISDLQAVEPAMQRWWQKLQTQTLYPWGKLRPYGTLSGDRITLTHDFDLLSATQRVQVLEQLRLEQWPSELLTESEQASISARQLAVNTTMSPYKVYARDGRVISLPYDGCTRYTLWTEFDRYQLNFGRTHSAEIRNAGKPSWRQVNFPIAAAAEKSVRLKFWNAMGYQYRGWITWVPEHGYFEILVSPLENNPKLRLMNLQRFWSVAPQSYRYIVVNEVGMVLDQKILNLKKKGEKYYVPNCPNPTGGYL